MAQARGCVGGPKAIEKAIDHRGQGSALELRLLFRHADELGHTAIGEVQPRSDGPEAFAVLGSIALGDEDAGVLMSNHRLIG